MNPFILQQKQILNVLRLISPHKVLGYPKIRVGNLHDGGYVMIDDFKGIKRALSFGIGGDDSWDLEIANRGIPVIQCDHTIDKSPSNNPLFYFNQQRVDADVLMDLTYLDEDIILKCDIEGDEWDMFDLSPPSVLDQITQIVVEFHFMVSLAEEQFLNRASRVFHKLYNQFAVVHVHGNNFGNLTKVVNIPIPETIELTFANRRRYTFAPNIETFPVPSLDYPNNPHGPDIWLGTFQF